MRAVLLAAGRGRRLGIDGPKCLLEIGGRSLLSRHLSHLEGAGVTALTIVSGHAREALEEAVRRDLEGRAQAGRPLDLDVEVIFNERFERGSLVSLHCAFGRLAAGGIWMDADVMYPTALLRRLVASPHGSCALLDGRSEEQGEEMMLGVRDGRLFRIGRRVGEGWDLVGESVGFFKISADDAPRFGRVLDAEVAAGRLDQEHEEGLDKALAELSFGIERVDDFAWTEIDFPEDVARAEALAQD